MNGYILYLPGGLIMELRFTQDIDYDGDIEIIYNGKDYALRGIIIVEYVMEAEYRSKFDSYDVEQSRIESITSDEIALLDEDDKELVITDKGEIEKILHDEKVLDHFNYHRYDTVTL